jgi:hypothetical protein
VATLLHAEKRIPVVNAGYTARCYRRSWVSRRSRCHLVFCGTRRVLDRRAPQLWTLAFPDRSVWVCWPKKSSSLFVDLTEDQVREVVSPGGLVDVKACAVDADWSGLKLMVRRELREK